MNFFYRLTEYLCMLLISFIFFPMAEIIFSFIHEFQQYIDINAYI